LCERRLQPRQALERRAGAGVLVLGHRDGLALPAGDLDRHDLLGPAPLPFLGLALAAQRELVLLLAGVAVLPGQVLGGLTHDAARPRIGEPGAVPPVDPLGPAPPE